MIEKCFPTYRQTLAVDSPFRCLDVVQSLSLATNSIGKLSANLTFTRPARETIRRLLKKSIWNNSSLWKLTFRTTSISQQLQFRCDVPDGLELNVPSSHLTRSQCNVAQCYAVSASCDVNVWALKRWLPWPWGGQTEATSLSIEYYDTQILNVASSYTSYTVSASCDVKVVAVTLERPNWGH